MKNLLAEKSRFIGEFGVQEYTLVLFVLQVLYIKMKHVSKYYFIYLKVDSLL